MGNLNDPMRVTTRSVPLRCGACNGTGVHPGFEDEDDHEPCPPCESKGWLWVTETTSEPAMPTFNYTVPTTLPGYQCSVCHQWVQYGASHRCINFAGGAP